MGVHHSTNQIRFFLDHVFAGYEYLADVSIEGFNSNYNILHTAKVFDPIKPALILPEVVDESKW
jgi:hypothetical protein